MKWYPDHRRRCRWCGRDKKRPEWSCNACERRRRDFRPVRRKIVPGKALRQGPSRIATCAFIFGSCRKADTASNARRETTSTASQTGYDATAVGTQTVFETTGATTQTVYETADASMDTSDLVDDDVVVDLTCDDDSSKDEQPPPAKRQRKDDGATKRCGEPVQQKPNGATASSPIDVTSDDAQPRGRRSPAPYASVPQPRPAMPHPRPAMSQPRPAESKTPCSPRRAPPSARNRARHAACAVEELRAAAEQERLLAAARRRFLNSRSRSDSFATPTAGARWQSHNPYVVLGVPQNADFATCRKAWLKLALKYHPDKSPSPSSRDTFDAVAKAYQKLQPAPP